MKLRPRSLFWTFAGAFLVVVVVATVLQVLVVRAFFAPALQRLLQGEARTRAAAAAQAIAAGGDASEAAVAAVLRAQADTGSQGARGLFIAFRSADGNVTMGRPVPGMLRRWAASGPDVPGAGAEARGGRRRLVVLARELVQIDAEMVGEVVAIAREPRVPIVPAGTPIPAMLLMPVALVVAALAGLLMFVLFLRRIRRMETLALRVAQGDLTARVDDRGGDELSRLAAQLDRMTERLAESRAQVEAAERQRRQLLADVSHELATPLTSVRGFAETLLNPDVSLSSEERARYLQHLLEETHRLDLLVTDLFDLARLEAGTAPLETESIDLVALTRATLERRERGFADAGIEALLSEVPDAAWVTADGRRLEQVLDNLLSNAQRYVPAGGRVWVSVAAGTHQSAPVWSLRVEDDGPGFPAEALPHVFDRFWRADQARATSGTGLGLAIVREIVARHGGRVWAEGRQPSGAAVVVELPARRAS